jgi:hypothetical protein
MAYEKKKGMSRLSRLINRKSPAISATKQKLGSTSWGNDGKLWRVAKSGRSKKWIRVSKAQLAKRFALPRKYHGKKARINYRTFTMKRGLLLSRAKGRKGPQASATQFSVGTRKRGNDGAMWEIIHAGSSKRWKRV